MGAIFSAASLLNAASYKGFNCVVNRETVKPYASVYYSEPHCDRDTENGNEIAQAGRHDDLLFEDGSLLDDLRLRIVKEDG